MNKPYCVLCPQSVMGMFWIVLGVCILLAGIFGRLHWIVSAVLLVQIGLGCAIKQFRRVTFDRRLMTVVFALIAIYSVYRICVSDEPWDTTPKCEDDIPAWNGGARRDPGGEKVAYAMLFVLFAALAALPWLPAGNRYYRTLKDENS